MAEKDTRQDRQLVDAALIQAVAPVQMGAELFALGDGSGELFVGIEL